MFKQVIEEYVFLMVLLFLMNDDTKVTLYAVRDSKLSVRTRTLPTWYTSKRDALYSGKDVVRTYVPVSALVGNHMFVAQYGMGYVLMHGTRRYAQRMTRKVGA